MKYSTATISYMFTRGIIDSFSFKSHKSLSKLHEGMNGETDCIASLMALGARLADSLENTEYKDEAIGVAITNLCDYMKVLDCKGIPAAKVWGQYCDNLAQAGESGTLDVFSKLTLETQLKELVSIEELIDDLSKNETCESWSPTKIRAKIDQLGVKADFPGISAMLANVPDGATHISFARPRRFLKMLPGVVEFWYDVENGWGKPIALDKHHIDCAVALDDLKSGTADSVYSERAIASAIAKSCSGYSVGQVLEIIRKAPDGTTHLSLISTDDVYYMRALSGDMVLWHNHTGKGWKSTHPLESFTNNLTSLESLKAVESIEPTASNQEERELMDPDLHFLNDEVPHISGKLLGNEDVAREFSCQYVDPERASKSFTVNEKLDMPDAERIIPAGQHIPEQSISDVHELAVIQLGDVTVTVDQLKKKVSIVAKNVELNVDENFSLSGKVNV